MAKSKAKTNSRKYKNFQFAFRVKNEQVLKSLQDELSALYEKFNKGRDPQDPKGIRAVKINDIALKAIKIGMEKIKKMNDWDFEEE